MNLLKDLKTNWYNILPLKMYELSICTLVQTLCQAILDRIFVDARPIEEQLVFMIAVTLEDIVSDIITLFEVGITFLLLNIVQYL